MRFQIVSVIGIAIAALREYAGVVETRGSLKCNQSVTSEKGFSMRIQGRIIISVAICIICATACGVGTDEVDAYPICAPDEIQDCQCGDSEIYSYGTQECNDSGTGWDECECSGDTESDIDSESDSDSDCACSPQQPETFGDCGAGEEIAPTITEVVDIKELYCAYYHGPTEPAAAAEVEFYTEDDSDYVNSFAAFKGDIGWADFKTVCMTENPELTEDDFPAVDFSTQRAVFFVATYEYDCTYDGALEEATRIGDLDDGSVQIVGYLCDTGTEIDCDLEGSLWWEPWLVVLKTTSEIRTCLEIAISPPA